MDLSSILKDLSIGTAISGNEEKFSLIIKSMFEKKCTKVEIDKFNNVIGIIEGSGANSKKIMISAHFDEIGFLVKSIDDRGFIKFTNIGGIDSKILLAQEVIVHGKNDIIGIIGAKPPHLLKSEETKKAVKLEDLSIDTGMKVEKVKEMISIGDLISFRTVPFVLQGNKVSSKAMDNRSGIAVLLEIMDEVYKYKHECDIYFVATTQEEVGLRGAIIAAFNVNPDLAIVIDACHGNMPDAPKDEVYILGKGPAIGIGPNLHKKMTNKIIEIAKEDNMPYQIDVEPGDTGTEAWAMQVSRVGIPTALISIPVRYMHTTVETVQINDVKNAAKLVAKFISKSQTEMEEILCI